MLKCSDQNPIVASYGSLELGRNQSSLCLCADVCMGDDEAGVEWQWVQKGS